VAIILNGTMVAGISGTVGGVTYSRGHCGPFAKQWAQGSNPQTARQMSVRGLMTQYGAVWNGMGSTLQAAWDAFGLVAPEVIYNRLGQVVTLSGWAWFVKVNQRRASLGLSPITDVPTTSAVGSAAALTLTVTTSLGSGSTLAWGGAPLPSGYGAILFLGIHTTGGAQRKKGGYRLVYAQEGPSTSPVVIGPGIAAAFGGLVHGWQAFGRCFVQRDDGVRSPVAVCYTVVV
jgi:hypothetical protein